MSDPVRVRIDAGWSSFHGLCGEAVVMTPDCVMVLIDGERAPLRFGPLEVQILEVGNAATEGSGTDGDSGHEPHT